MCSPEPEWRLAAFAFDADFLQTSAGGVLGTADDSELEQTLLKEGWAKRGGAERQQSSFALFFVFFSLSDRIYKRKFKGRLGVV